jgi:hypothetical protein
MKFHKYRVIASLVAALGIAAIMVGPDVARAQAPDLGADAADGAAPPAARKRVAKKKVAKKKVARAEAGPRNGALVVDNRREATLLELTATPAKGGAAVVIARDVPAGSKASGKLPPKAGCVFNLSGSFDDESSMDAANMNLCKDGRINLVE